MSEDLIDSHTVAGATTNEHPLAPMESRHQNRLKPILWLT